MDGFPRIRLFSPREVRALAGVGVAVLALTAGAIAYVRPPGAARAVAAAPTPTPRSPVFVNVIPASAATAYLTTFAAGGGLTESALRTDDGGRTWHRLRLPGPASAFGLTPLAGSPGDVVLTTYPGAAGGTRPPTAPPEYWVSHDRGGRWTAFSVPGADGPSRGVEFLDRSHWYHVSTGAEGFSLLVSHDEGASWQEEYSIPGPDPRIDGQQVVSGSVVAAGGTAWLLLLLGTASPASDGSTIFVGQPRYQLLRSPDSGSTWTAVSLPEPPPGAPAGAGYAGLRFTTAEAGSMLVYPTGGAGSGFVARTQAPSISTTSDGGSTWSPLRTLEHFPYFTAPGSADWWATDGELLFHSTDLGLTWSSSKPSLPRGERLQTIQRATAEVAWNVFGGTRGSVGEVPDRTHVMRTTDGGRHWAEVSVPGL